MKARLRKTGEIVDIICYGGSPHYRSAALDYVNYIDSQGVEHIGDNHLNYYWDFEPIETTNNEPWQTDDIIDWDYYRIHAAIAAMQGLLSNSSKTGSAEEYVEAAIGYANTLVEELKKK